MGHLDQTFERIGQERALDRTELHRPDLSAGAFLRLPHPAHRPLEVPRPQLQLAEDARTMSDLNDSQVHVLRELLDTPGRVGCVATRRLVQVGRR